MKDQKKGSGGTRKFGRNKVKCAQYRALHMREKNKLRRILRSCPAEAERYAGLHNLTGYLGTLTA